MLAIVIPYYKFQFFEATLQSLHAQTNKRFVVYIGNDAGPVDPEPLIQQYERHFPIVYQKFEDNLGKTSLVRHWNRCLSMIQDEEWLMILGDDDVLDSHVVATFYDHLAAIQKAAHVVRFATVKIDEKDGVTSPVYQHDPLENAVDLLFSGKRSSLSEYIFNRNRVLTIGFRELPLAWYSDILAVLEFSDFKKIYSINEAIVKIRVSSSSISGSTDNFKLKAEAALQFYTYLLQHKSTHFNKAQRIQLVEKLSKSFLQNKKAFGYFFTISKIYFRLALPYRYLLFLKRIVFSTLKVN
ncbi:glycosyltransferase family A protein [Flavobacterium sp.]|uniref:glycosyltransferase family A protein n=1 Tax=Flavobacterium sp. TaxID=239 RepID=UPI002FDEECAB